jgi:hypothetical protein
MHVERISSCIGIISRWTCHYLNLALSPRSIGMYDSRVINCPIPSLGQSSVTQRVERDGGLALAYS